MNAAKAQLNKIMICKKESVHVIKSIQLKSEESTFMLPSLNEEIAQHLTISHTGRVYLSRYGFRGVNDYRLLKKEYAKITPEAASELFGYLKDYLGQSNLMDAMDSGIWELTVRYDDGEAVVHGPLLGGVSGKGTDLTEWIRKNIPLDNLMAFGTTEDEEDD